MPKWVKLYFTQFIACHFLWHRANKLKFDTYMIITESGLWCMAAVFLLFVFIKCSPWHNHINGWRTHHANNYYVATTKLHFLLCWNPKHSLFFQGNIRIVTDSQEGSTDAVSIIKSVLSWSVAEKCLWQFLCFSESFHLWTQWKYQWVKKL